MRSGSSVTHSWTAYEARLLRSDLFRYLYALLQVQKVAWDVANVVPLMMMALLSS